MPCAAPVTMATLPSKRPMKAPLRGLGDDLGLQVLLESGDTQLPADPGLLVAAEGRVGGIPDRAVDAERAGADPPGHGTRAVEVGAVDGTGEPVGGVVGDAHRVVVTVVRDDHQ